MTRDEFINLPLKAALIVLWELARAKLENMPAPKLPLPPKFDGRLGRQGGFVWYSEMDLESLHWWFNTKSKAAKDGGQYAESNAKAAASLDKWIQWRSMFPEARWSGKRGDDKVTAEPPSREPKLREWPKRTESAQTPGTTATRNELPPSDGGYGF